MPSPFAKGVRNAPLPRRDRISISGNALRNPPKASAALIRSGVATQCCCDATHVTHAPHKMRHLAGLSRVTHGVSKESEESRVVEGVRDQTATPQSVFRVLHQRNGRLRAGIEVVLDKHLMPLGTAVFNCNRE